MSAYLYSLNMMETITPTHHVFYFLVCDCVELVFLMPNAHSKTHSKPPGVALAHLIRNAKSVKNAQNLRQTHADVTLFC